MLQYPKRIKVKITGPKENKIKVAGPKENKKCRETNFKWDKVK